MQPNLGSCSATGDQIAYSLQKRLKAVGKKLFLIINCISWCNALIPTIKLPLEYEKQEYHCKSPLVTYGCTSQGVEHSLFWG